MAEIDKRDSLRSFALIGRNLRLANWMDGFWRFKAFMDKSGRPTTALRDQSSLFDVVNPAKKMNG